MKLNSVEFVLTERRYSRYLRWHLGLLRWWIANTDCWNVTACNTLGCNIAHRKRVFNLEIKSRNGEHLFFIVRV
jgi:hypothetical protein